MATSSGGTSKAPRIKQGLRTFLGLRTKNSAQETTVPDSNYHLHDAVAPMLHKSLLTSTIAIASQLPSAPSCPELTPEYISVESIPVMVTDAQPLKTVSTTDRVADLHPLGPDSEDGAHRPIISNNNSNVNQVSGSGNTLINNNPVTIHYVIYGPIPNESDAIQIKITTDLKTCFVPQAVYDAQLSSGCMEGTRVEILRNIISWIKDPDGQSIFWLTGWAGTGKTAIAWTVCSQASDDPEIALGGSFFCSRSASQALQRDVRCVIPTLAQLLARQSTTFSQALADELARDPDVVQKHVPVQIERLLTRPLLSLTNSPVPIVFVIDALDECGDQPTNGGMDDGTTRRFVTEMLEALVAFSKNKVKLPVKFFVTSRPETHIRDTPVSDAEFSKVLRLHTVLEEQVTADIRRYIAAKLLGSSKLRLQFTVGDVDKLARLSDGLFIYAATALQYTLGDGVDVAMKRFKAVLNVSEDAASSGATRPLDRMYALVLADAATADEMSATMKLLAALLSARMVLSIAALAELLDLENYDVRATLSRLHAVIHVPDTDGKAGLRTLHASFGDYLFTRAPNHIRISQTLGHEAPAHGCLRVMSECLHFNISHSRSSYEPNIPSRPDSITPSVEYACTQWAYHVSNLPQTSELEKLIDDILRRQFMFWLEVMSVLGQVHRATAMLFLVTKAVKSPGLVRFLRDANRFVASSQAAIECSAPHIYLSALPFADNDSLIYRTFAPYYVGLISISLFGINPHGRRHIMTLRGHERGVTSVTYSSDGLLIVSGSHDSTVRIWDAYTGEEVMPPLLSGNEPVECVAMALSGRGIAAGTASGAVWVWDIQASSSTRCLRLLGSSERSMSVAFSLNGGLIASLNSRETVDVWSADTGQVLAVLTCQIRKPCTVSFTSDGQITVSGSSDWMIKDPAGGNRPVMSSSRFSPNGKFIVAANGHDVSLWTRGDTTEWSLVSLDGHTDEVLSVVFSPNASYFASASDDGTIRIWDTDGSEATDQSQPRVVCWPGIRCISARGVYIASIGGSPANVRVRNVGTGERQFQLPQGYPNMLSYMAVSSDGLLVAIGHFSGSIQLRDTSTGETVARPWPDNRLFACWIAFTPDTKWLAFILRAEMNISEEWVPPRPLHVWDVVHRRESTYGPIYIHEDADAAAISSDARLVAVPGTSGADTLSGFQLWERKDGSTILRYFLGEGPVRCMQFSPDDTRIMTAGWGSHGCDSCVWNVSTGDLIFMLTANQVVVIAWSPDDQSIATVSRGDVVCLWDAETGALTATLSLYDTVMSKDDDAYAMRIRQGTTSCIASGELVGFTVDGASMVSVSGDGLARVWDVSTARSLHSKGVSDVDLLASATPKDGWLTGPAGELLVWVPAAYRLYLQLPPCTQRSGIESVHISVGTEGWHRGETWTSCWRGDASDAVTNVV